MPSLPVLPQTMAFEIIQKFSDREVCAFVYRCSACGLVLELEVCRVRFARVSCPRLRFM